MSVFHFYTLLKQTQWSTWVLSLQFSIFLPLVRTRLISSGHTFLHGVTCVVIDQYEQEKQLGKHSKYKKKGLIFQCQISGLISCNLAACRHPGRWCSLWGSAEQTLCLVQMLHLSASSGICSQETHIHRLTLWIPFMSQGYKDLLPWRKSE